MGKVVSAAVDEAFIIEREVTDHPDMWIKWSSHEWRDEALEQRDRFAQAYTERNFRVVRVLTTTITQVIE